MFRFATTKAKQWATTSTTSRSFSTTPAFSPAAPSPTSSATTAYVPSFLPQPKSRITASKPLRHCAKTTTAPTRHRHPLHSPRRSINWSHFSPRTEAQKKRFWLDSKIRTQGHNGHFNMLLQSRANDYHVTKEESELLLANTWLEGRYGVHELTLHEKSRLPTNYLNDFPDC